MKRIAALVWLTAIAIAALGLFHVKYEVQRLEQDLGEVQQRVLEHRETIHVLKAEWSFLNQPRRISDLASRHLDLTPMTAAQVVTIDDLPLRETRHSATPEPVAGATLASARTAQ